MEEDTGGFNEGDEEGDEAGPNGYAMGAPIDSAYGKSTAGDACNCIESHGITDGWWTSTSPEG